MITSCWPAAAKATTTIRLAVETMPSLAPKDHRTQPADARDEVGLTMQAAHGGVFRCGGLRRT
jgi:hypothetical protein